MRTKHWYNDTDMRGPSTLTPAYSSDPLYTTNNIRTGPGSNPGFRSDRQVTIRLVGDSTHFKHFVTVTLQCLKPEGQ